MGRPLMPHQRLTVDVGLEVQSEEAGDPEPGEWAYTDVTGTMQRRAGKTAIQSPLVTHRARMVRGAQMFMTAQNRNKARRRWFDITEDLLRSPLRHDVRRKVSQSHEELRWLDGGASLIPFAPNEDEMHSETPDLVLIDELWAFSNEQAGLVKAGYVPAFATTGGQAWKFSTAGTDRSEWLNDEVAAGRRIVERQLGDVGARLGKAYLEWSLPDRVDGRRLKALPDDVLIEACILHHPAVCHAPGCTGPRRGAPCLHGFTVRPAAVRAAFAEMTRPEFLRAYGNRSAADLSTSWSVIDQTTWVGAVDDGAIPASARVAFGVWVDEDAEDAAVAAGWRDDLGRMHVEHLQLDAGIRWIHDYVTGSAERNDPLTVAVANVGPARDVADELERAGVPVQRIGQADVAAAVSRHRSELDTGKWRHRRSLEADAAAEHVTLHRAAGGQRWDSGADTISALGAQTMAGWGFDHAPAPKTRRKMKVR